MHLQSGERTNGIGGIMPEIVRRILRPTRRTSSTALWPGLLSLFLMAQPPPPPRHPPCTTLCTRSGIVTMPARSPLCTFQPVFS